MRPTPTAALALALLLLLPASPVRADAPQGDKDLEGVWEARSFIRDGKDEPQAPGKVLLTFRGDALTLRVGDEVRKASVTVDAGKTPHTIDMAYRSGPDKGRTVRGLYEVKGDELRICHGEAGRRGRRRSPPARGAATASASGSGSRRDRGRAGSPRREDGRPRRRHDPGSARPTDGRAAAARPGRGGGRQGLLRGRPQARGGGQDRRQRDVGGGIAARQVPRRGRADEGAFERPSREGGSQRGRAFGGRLSIRDRAAVSRSRPGCVRAWVTVRKNAAPAVGRPRGGGRLEIGGVQRASSSRSRWSR